VRESVLCVLARAKESVCEREMTARSTPPARGNCVCVCVRERVCVSESERERVCVRETGLLSVHEPLRQDVTTGQMDGMASVGMARATDRRARI